MSSYEERYVKFSSMFLLLIFVAGLMVGGLGIHYLTTLQIDQLEQDISLLEAEISTIEGGQNVVYQNITIYQNGTALPELFAQVEDSIVFIQGATAGGTVQGSGFIYTFQDSTVVITNYHVVHDTTTLGVTFSSGKGYPAEVIGIDPYADLAVLTVAAPPEELRALTIVSSSTLRVGDIVIAIGNPYGLVGSMTTGVVSALDRTITEEYAEGYLIANIIQISAPINPGNSGGPLLNGYGEVIGVTTAIIEDSEGLGFAIPSSTILREIQALIDTGTYEGHSRLGVRGVDMDYLSAQSLDIDVTYGWRIMGFLENSPAQASGVQINDILITMNSTTIKNGDDLASYLEEYTLPGETLILTVVRNAAMLDFAVVLDQRPAP